MKNTQPEMNSKELHQRFEWQFEDYKEKLKRTEYSNMNHLLSGVNNESDKLLDNVKFEADQFINKHLANRNGLTASEESRRAAKAECLIKLQTLTSKMTCHVLKMLDEGKCGDNNK